MYTVLSSYSCIVSFHLGKRMLLPPLRPELELRGGSASFCSHSALRRMSLASTCNLPPLRSCLLLLLFCRRGRFSAVRSVSTSPVMKQWAQWRKWRRLSQQEWKEKGAITRFTNQMDIINAGVESSFYSSKSLSKEEQETRRKEITEQFELEKRLITSIRAQARPPQTNYF